MKEPHWLNREVALALHDMLLSQYGGCAGVRDQGLLDSALARPQQAFAYGKPTLAELAAAYAGGSSKIIPFSMGTSGPASCSELVFWN